MTGVELLLVGLAGLGAGVINAVAGAGTLLTFPTLLLLGVPPVVANVSNTVGLVPGSVAAAVAFRGTLRGRGPQVRRLLAVATLGGLAGGALLILLPGRIFEAVVPWLLLTAAVLAALQPRIAGAVALRRAARTVVRADAAAGSSSTAPADRGARAGAAATFGVLLIGVYGGYFGAAQGVMLLVVLGVTLGGPLTELNGLKNVLGGTVNLVSALLFIAVAEVDWAVAGALALGSTLGGALGGRYGRRLSPAALRVVLVIVAVVAAVSRLLG